MNMKTNKFLTILFLIIGFMAILEFYFIRGIFTGPLMMILVSTLGIINIIIKIKEKNILCCLLYILTTVSLFIGYLSYM